MLAYVKALVIYSAKQRGFSEELIKEIYPEDGTKVKVVNGEQDVLNFKNRIIIIVRVLIYMCVDGEIPRASSNPGHGA